MKKVSLLLLTLLPLLLQAEVIVTKHNGNIENVLDVDTTDNVIYFVHDYQTKSLDRNEIVAIIYEDGLYKTIYHTETDQTNDGASLDQRPEGAWVDLQVEALHTFPDGSQGIIFYVTNDGHGLAVSLNETTASWDISKKKYMQDITAIPNIEDAMPIITQLGEGAYYTSSILHQAATNQYPAAAWCAALGEGWYLPTASELLYLFVIANNNKGNRGPISRAIIKNGGIGLNGDWYWTSSENDRTEAINITNGGFCSSEKKGESNSVRAIKAF